MGDIPTASDTDEQHLLRRLKGPSDFNLRVTLQELIAQSDNHSVLTLSNTLWNLRAAFDPASITMSSTNIPDAIIKLSGVLTETAHSSQRVFELVENQHKLLGQSERELGELERLCSSEGLTSETILSYISHQRALHAAMRVTSQELISSQSFQDLCGQKVKKVMKLLCDVECYLREALSQLKIDVSAAPNMNQKDENPDIDQQTTDELLKQLGL